MAPSFLTTVAGSMGMGIGIESAGTAGSAGDAEYIVPAFL